MKEVYITQYEYDKLDHKENDDTLYHIVFDDEEEYRIALDYGDKEKMNECINKIGRLNKAVIVEGGIILCLVIILGCLIF